jgi:hypothetical protein
VDLLEAEILKLKKIHVFDCLAEQFFGGGMSANQHLEVSEKYDVRNRSQFPALMVSQDSNRVDILGELVLEGLVCLHVLFLLIFLAEQFGENSHLYQATQLLVHKGLPKSRLDPLVLDIISLFQLGQPVSLESIKLLPIKLHLNNEEIFLVGFQKGGDFLVDIYPTKSVLRYQNDHSKNSVFLAVLLHRIGDFVDLFDDDLQPVFPDFVFYK